MFVTQRKRARLPTTAASFQARDANAFSINIEHVIVTVFTDGHEACKIALQVQLPLAFQIFCLQHARKNISDNISKWVSDRKQKMQDTKERVEVFSTLSNPFLRDLAIRRTIKQWSGINVSSERVVDPETRALR